MKLGRRQFVTTTFAAGGVFFCRCGLSAQAPVPTLVRRQVVIGGRRVRTIDMHAHVFIDEAWPLVKDFPQTDKAMANLGASPMAIDQAALDRRFQQMDREGIDVHVISVHPSQFLYFLQPDLAARIVKMQNEKIAALVAAHADRFVGFGNISLQQPDLAVEQLEYAVKSLGLRGFIVGANVNGGELANPKFDPVWKKIQDLQTVVMIHPQGFDDTGKRFDGAGALGNNIGFPLDTTIALAHLIFEGVLDRFPGVKIIGAHAGGFLASYIGRFDNCNALQVPCQKMKRKPSEYLRGPQLHFDSLVYSPQNLRNIITACGASQVVIGTDFGFPIASATPVDTVLQTPGLTLEEQRAVLGAHPARVIRVCDRGDPVVGTGVRGACTSVRASCTSVRASCTSVRGSCTGFRVACTYKHRARSYKYFAELSIDGSLQTKRAESRPRQPSAPRLQPAWWCVTCLRCRCCRPTARSTR